MDKDTRNAIERATQRARKLLEEDFAAQLEGDFDVHRDGKVAARAGGHLSARQAFRRERIVAAIEHKRAAGMNGADSVADYLRDTAFTTLNRFVALKMLEARELVQECITRGEQSAGFREYCGMAPGLPLLPDSAGYRLYIECVFDELSTGLKVLFNRQDLSSVLWPRRACFEELLRTLNAAELATVWAEDETIGWVYQYYNTSDERKTMRDGSAAPRSSRELAVRNQFFTPRYVVEFLTDNTLGRLWYEMNQGRTRLKEQCRYLVRQPAEIFLRAGEIRPERAGAPGAEPGESPSGEEPLQLPVYILHRALKDPREIRLLDPACGSMHFGLYAFDLLTVIYLEAWEIAHATDEAAKIAGTFARFVTFAASFPDQASFLREVPRLIVEHNLHGIDIDPRAVQIAGLSLWLRAQRAWHLAGVKPTDRPRITRSNLVCAEPMPGESELLREFVENQFPPGERPAFAFLLGRTFDKMTLAGEAGSLLQIDQEIRTAVAEARALATSQSAPRQPHLFPSTEQAELAELDLRSLNDDEFWHAAEQRIYDALEGYAEHADNDGRFQRRLFADDAGQGFAFIALCRKRYDVVVTNPPFGLPPNSARVQKALASAYPKYKKNLACAFIYLARKLLLPSGSFGIICDRSLFFRRTYKPLRIDLLDGGDLQFADLGWEVMDNANVEAAAFTASSRGSQNEASAVFFDVRQAEDRADLLRRSVRGTPRRFDAGGLKRLPSVAFAHWVLPSLIQVFRRFEPARPRSYAASNGMSACDSPRFLRLWWEVPPSETGWKPLAHGGKFSPFIRPLYFVANWRQQGAEIKQYIVQRYPYLNGDPGWVLHHEELFFKPGLTYGKRALVLSAQVMPTGVIFSDEGQSVFPSDGIPPALVLGFLNSRLSRYLINTYCGQHKHSGYLNALPWLDFTSELQTQIVANTELGIQLGQKWERWNEPCSRHFVPSVVRGNELRAAFRHDVVARYSEACEYLEAWSHVQTEIECFAGLSAAERGEYLRACGGDPSEQSFPEQAANPTAEEALEGEALAEAPCADEEDDADGSGAVNLPASQYGVAVELALNLRVPVRQLTSNILAGNADSQLLAPEAARYIDEAVGYVFGRWDIRYAAGERPQPELPDPFAPIPICPPGILQGDDGLPLSSEGGRRLLADNRYPLDVAWDGILVEDSAHPLDVERRVHRALAVLWGDRSESVANELCELTGVPSLREWFRDPACFFTDHLKRYSKSRRQAPIYWPLSTASNTYTLWLYYHRFERDTLYRCLELLKEKLQHEETLLARLTAERAGRLGARQRKELDWQETFVAELRELHEDVARVAPLWNPKLNDGVIINHAPLWRMITHKPWQKAVKACWNELQGGGYDWAHLAMHLWPERVVPKCAKDRSLAIAHGLEDVFWVEGTDSKWTARKTPTRSIDELVRERTSPAVKSALKTLLEAPAAAGKSGGRRGGGRRKSAAAAEGGDA